MFKVGHYLKKLQIKSRKFNKLAKAGIGPHTRWRETYIRVNKVDEELANDNSTHQNKDEAIGRVMNLYHELLLTGFNLLQECAGENKLPGEIRLSDEKGTPYWIGILCFQVDEIARRLKKRETMSLKSARVLMKAAKHTRDVQSRGKLSHFNAMEERLGILKCQDDVMGIIIECMETRFTCPKCKRRKSNKESK